MRVVTIEEHWTTPEIDRALRTQPSRVRDASVALNDVGDISARLFRQALEYISVDRILLSGDYPFHQLEAGAIGKFLATRPDRAAREKVAHANAEALYRLGPNPGEPS